MKSKGSLLYSQEPTTSPCPEQHKAYQNLISSCILRFPSGRFLSNLPTTIIYVCQMHTICFAHLILKISSPYRILRSTNYKSTHAFLFSLLLLLPACIQNILRKFQPMFSQCEIPSFTPIQNNR
jgi:hypothetical protein